MTAPQTDVISTTLLELLQRREPHHSTVDDTQQLVSDLGLTSLELAELVAVLEMRLKFDPFAESVPIASIHTVGDLRRAYLRSATT